ncbi:hypothetical protein MACH09_03610 [Vibrio sp. MACH09]|nr:hypothetical protein MACH09_03610 [Vibrio sp. MACH09]
MPFKRLPAKLCLATMARLGPGDIAPSKQIVKRDNQTVNDILNPYSTKQHLVILSVKTVIWLKRNSVNILFEITSHHISHDLK